MCAADLRVTIVADLGTPSMRGRLERLHERDRAGNFFVSPEWVLLGQRFFAQTDVIPWAMVVEDGDELRGLFPLTHRTLPWYRGRVREVALMGHDESNKPSWLIDGAPNAVARAWVDEMISRTDWDVTRLTGVPAHTPGLSAMTTEFACHGFSLREQLQGAALVMSVTGDFDEFWRSRSKNLRRDISKKLNRADQIGEISWEVSSPSDDPIEWAARLIGVSEHSWKVEGGSSLAQGSRRDFYAAALRIFLPRDEARVFVLKIDDIDIAYYLCFLGGRTLYCFKTDYDERSSELSPGLLLLKFVAEHSFADEAIDRVDFIITLPYTSRWADGEFPNVDFVVYNRTRRGQLLRQWDEHLERRVAAASVHASRLLRRGRYGLRRVRDSIR